MMKYAKIIDNAAKIVEAGSGTNEAYYRSVGMTLMDVEQGYDGQWYVAGYAPEMPLSEQEAQLREQRNRLLSETDKFMIADYPIAETEQEQYRQYRQYLRNLPAAADFPTAGILSFEEWNTKNGEGA